MLAVRRIKRMIPLAACLFVLRTLVLFHSSLYQTVWLQYGSRQETLRHRLSTVFPYDVNRELPKHIWQTWKTTSLHEDFPPEFQYATSSWADLNPDFVHEILDDDGAAVLISRLYVSVKEIPEAFNALPEPVLKADFFRYLVLLAWGGVYSDIDTTALKPVEEWSSRVTGTWGLIVGIEADADRPDWRDWFARRLQLCQWTIASKPGHPALVDIVASIAEETLQRKAQQELDSHSMKPVMEFTGPGIWTDSVFRHFNADTSASNTEEVTWERFTNLTQPIKQKDVIVLPITSFSPGVGVMGSRGENDPLAFVKHWFKGSWKT